MINMGLDEMEKEVIDALMRGDAPTQDDNEEILGIIKDRMAVGVERYGHGLRNGDDTRQWGTDDDSWVEMALEEALDLSIYLATQIIRLKRIKAANLKDSS